MRIYTKRNDPSLIVSHLTLRRIVGILGICLPLLCLGCSWLGLCNGIQDSISLYYGTPVRNLMVGILFTLAWFLFAYRGHSVWDDIAGDFACLFALGVALFPVTSENDMVEYAHYASAAAMFIVLAFFCLYLFRKREAGVTPTPKKEARDRVYLLCGLLIVTSIVGIGVCQFLLQGTALDAWQPVFWLESFSLWAFGVAWFIKGETLLKDD